MLKNIIKDNILFILIILLLGYVIFTTNNIKTDVGLYNQKIDSIQHTVDSATEVNKQADIKLSKIDMLENIYIFI